MGLLMSNVPFFVVNKPFGFALPFYGGTPPYSFRVTSGSLPPGLLLTTRSGEILGTPTPAAVGNTYVVGITITDAIGNSGRPYYYSFARFVQ